MDCEVVPVLLHAIRAAAMANGVAILAGILIHKMESAKKPNAEKFIVKSKSRFQPR